MRRRGREGEGGGEIGREGIETVMIRKSERAGEIEIEGKVREKER